MSAFPCKKPASASVSVFKGHSFHEKLPKRVEHVLLDGCVIFDTRLASNCLLDGYIYHTVCLRSRELETFSQSPFAVRNQSIHLRHSLFWVILRVLVIDRETLIERTGGSTTLLSSLLAASSSLSKSLSLAHEMKVEYMEIIVQTEWVG